MNHMALTGALLFVVLLAIARAWGTRALKLLSKRDRLKLVDVLIHFATIGMVPLLGVSAAYWSLLWYIDKIGPLLIYSYFLILLCHVIALYFLIVHKLRRLSLPAAYVRAATIGLGIQYLGLCCLFSGILLELWVRKV